MRVVYIVMFFILGCVFGSFYNLLGLRIPEHESIIKPASHCDKCGHKLSWYEMIPIFSYLFLKGKCRNCKTRLSILYLFSEFFCGVLFAISFYSFDFSHNFAIALILSSTMILVTVSDLTYMTIPDRFIVIPSILVLLIKLIFEGPREFLFAILWGILSFLIMFMIMKFGELIFKKESLGGADVKLMFLAGVSLEPFLCLLVIIVASFIALPVSLLLLVKKKENIIPFGPFLTVGMLIIFFTKYSSQEIINFLLQK